MTVGAAEWMNAIQWQPDGLVPVIAQDSGSGRVLMFAYMNRDALALTVQTGEAHYWSRSRGRMWRKGEESGHVQKVESIRLDCDGDVLLLRITQSGGIACHTGRASCFYRELIADAWETVDPIEKDPGTIYAARAKARDLTS